MTYLITGTSIILGTLMTFSTIF